MCGLVITLILIEKKRRGALVKSEFALLLVLKMEDEAMKEGIPTACKG